MKVAIHINHSVFRFYISSHCKKSPFLGALFPSLPSFSPFLPSFLPSLLPLPLPSSPPSFLPSFLSFFPPFFLANESLTRFPKWKGPKEFWYALTAKRTLLPKIYTTLVSSALLVAISQWAGKKFLLSYITLSYQEKDPRYQLSGFPSWQTVFFPD